MKTNNLLATMPLIFILEVLQIFKSFTLEVTSNKKIILVNKSHIFLVFVLTYLNAVPNFRN